MGDLTIFTDLCNSPDSCCRTHLQFVFHVVSLCYFQVQGMSFIAAVLLLNMEIAEAFTCFANLLNRPCQIAFFRLDENLVSKMLLYCVPKHPCLLLQSILVRVLMLILDPVLQLRVKFLDEK